MDGCFESKRASASRVGTRAEVRCEMKRERDVVGDRIASARARNVLRACFALLVSRAWTLF
jgi:hypothetical protein